MRLCMVFFLFFAFYLVLLAFCSASGWLLLSGSSPPPPSFVSTCFCFDYVCVYLITQKLVHPPLGRVCNLNFQTTKNALVEAPTPLWNILDETHITIKTAFFLCVRASLKLCSPQVGEIRL